MYCNDDSIEAWIVAKPLSKPRVVKRDKPLRGGVVEGKAYADKAKFVSVSRFN